MFGKHLGLAISKFERKVTLFRITTNLKRSLFSLPSVLEVQVKISLIVKFSLCNKRQDFAQHIFSPISINLVLKM